MDRGYFQQNPQYHNNYTIYKGAVIPPGEVSAAAHGHGAVKTAPYKPLVIVAS